MKWQPMENAPKDGRRLLLWIDHSVKIGTYNVARQFWCKEEFPYVATAPFYWQSLPLSPFELTEDEELDNAFYEAMAKDD